MKQIISLIFAGIIGGLVTLGGIKLMNDQSTASITESPEFTQKVNLVNTKPSLNSVPGDFKARFCIN